MKNLIIEIHVKITDNIARQIHKRGIGGLDKHVFNIVGEDGKTRKGYMKSAKIKEAQ